MTKMQPILIAKILFINYKIRWDESMIFQNCWNRFNLRKNNKTKQKIRTIISKESLQYLYKNPKDFIDFSQVNERKQNKTNKRDKVKSFNQIHCRFIVDK